MTQSHWQFTLRRAFRGVTLICLALGAYSWAGLLGVILFNLAMSVAMVGYAFWKPNFNYLLPGGLLTGIAVTLLLSGSRGIEGIGRVSLPCSVKVVDAAGQPIDSAAVRIRDVSRHGDPEGVPVHPVPAGEPGASGTSDEDGLETLTFGFRTSFKNSWFIYEEQLQVSPYYWIQVDAPGYERGLVRVDSILGTSYDSHELPLPQLTIRLKRAEAKLDR